MIAIERLKELGYTFSVRAGGKISYQFHGTPPPPQVARVLFAEVKSQKANAIAYLSLSKPSEGKAIFAPCEQELLKDCPQEDLAGLANFKKVFPGSRVIKFENTDTK
ncbi:MAG: hypothetical protein A2218_07850 [Elusimicrobia bacterium RIFOXYA2_FULL_53_38]|nr:MAG: hypothetical protein A2218_07850 [Elusimicrobia bacterium RIFOXYA2_FULL_53_38]